MKCLSSAPGIAGVAVVCGEVKPASSGSVTRGVNILVWATMGVSLMGAVIGLDFCF
jgi:hypothetical protein